MATTGDKSTRNIPEYRQIKPHTHMCTYTCTYARSRADIPTGNSAPKKFSLRPIYAAAAAAAAACSGARTFCRQEIFPFLLPEYHPAIAFSRSFSSFPPILLSIILVVLQRSFLCHEFRFLSFSFLFSFFFLFDLSLSFSFSFSLSCVRARFSLVLANPPIAYRYSFFYAFSVYHCASLFVSHSLFVNTFVFPTPEYGENTVRKIYTVFNSS